MHVCPLGLRLRALWHIGDRNWVKLHQLQNPLVPVLVEEILGDPYAPEVTHYGWRDTEGSQYRHNGVPTMIQIRTGADPKRALMFLSMCFPYGLDIVIKQGDGSVVALCIIPPPLMKPQIRLILVRPNSPPDSPAVSAQIGGTRVTPAMLEAAEDLLHTLNTGERKLPKDLYEVVARAFGTTRDDARGRILLAIYGGKGAPKVLPPDEPST